MTAKYQVTIPEEVRKRVGLKPGEEVEVLVLNDQELLLRRKMRRVRDPLSVLLGSKSNTEVSPERVDELAEG